MAGWACVQTPRRGRARKEPRRNGARALTGRGEACSEQRRRGGGVGRDQVWLLGAAHGAEDERAGERHGGGRDGEARMGAAR